MQTRKTTTKKLVFDRADTLVCITDIFLDAMAHSSKMFTDHADMISNVEIMRFLGVPEHDLDSVETEVYDLRKLRKKLKTQESCVIFAAIENKYLTEDRAGIAQW